MLGLIEITGPAVEPVTVDEMKIQARIDHDDEDALITSWIVAARRRAEAFCNRAFVTQRLEYSIDRFPGRQDMTLIADFRDSGAPNNVIYVPKPKLQTVSSITYIDPAGTSTVLNPSLYTVDTRTEPGRIVPSYGNLWPVTQNIPAAVVINYYAGYGVAAANVPADIKTAIMMMVSHWYRNREEVLVGTISSKIPAGVQSLLWHNRAPWVI